MPYRIKEHTAHTKRMSLEGRILKRNLGLKKLHSIKEKINLENPRLYHVRIRDLGHESSFAFPKLKVFDGTNHQGGEL